MSGGEGRKFSLPANINAHLMMSGRLDAGVVVKSWFKPHFLPYFRRSRDGGGCRGHPGHDRGPRDEVEVSEHPEDERRQDPHREAVAQEEGRRGGRSGSWRGFCRGH